MSDPSDSEILSKLRTNDPEGIRLLLKKYSHWAKGMIHQRFPDVASEFEEMLHTATIRVWRRFADREAPDVTCLRAWFCTIVANLALDELRQRKRRRQHFADQLISDPMQEGREPSEVVEALQEEVGRLKAEERAAIEARLDEGSTPNPVAFRRAMRHLRESLGRRFPNRRPKQ